jgi:hypothetical protein
MHWFLAVISAFFMTASWAENVVRYSATGDDGTRVIITSEDCVSPRALARLTTELPPGTSFSAQAAIVEIKDRPEMAGCWVGVSYGRGLNVIIITGEDGGVMRMEPSDFKPLTNT